MSMSFLTAIAMVFAATSLWAEGVNLLNNTGFKKDRTGFPAEWCYRRGKIADYVSAKGGEVTINPKSVALSFNQVDIHLVPGRRYRFGAEVRTAGTGNRARLVVYNYAWTKESSLLLPNDTKGEWKRIEQEFEAPESRDELYAFTLYCAAGAEKEFSMRSPFLVPVSGQIDEEERAPLFSTLKSKTPKVLPPPAFNDGKRLNSLVRRLLECDAQADFETEFSISADHWVWIALDGTQGSISVDGADAGAMAVEDSGKVEAMRYLTNGTHRVKVGNIDGKRKLIVNAVPTIMATSYPEPKIGSARLTGEFLERYLYPAFNTFSYGWVPSRISAEEWKTFAKRGRQMFGHLCRWNKTCRGYVNRIEPPGNLAMRFRRSLGMSHAYYSGLTFDEIAASDLQEKCNFTEALRYSCDLERPLWVWSSGVVYEKNPVNTDYLNSIIAASGGRGRLLFECYARTQPDEDAAVAYLDDYLDMSIKRAEAMVPNFVRSSMVVHGAYTRPGGYCTDCRADVDTKRFWDMYYHRLATCETFEGLAGIGLYAINNGEEEDLRWASRIIRHYALEGRSDMLSEKYGFKYKPGYIDNGDFAEGGKGWCAQAAAEGTIRFEKVKGFATLQSRRDQKAGGDTACVFKRSATRANVLRRKLTGLERGKLYSLRYVVAAVPEILSRKGEKRTLVFNAEIKGAEDVTASSPVVRWSERNRTLGVLNVRLMVFKALSSEAELVFSDWAAPDAPGAELGEELAFNFVRVVPYFER